MSASITHKAVAPNGHIVKVHTNDLAHGFVYAKGRRVYGRYSRTYTESEGFVSRFTPEGKWAYLLAANTSAPQSQAVEGDDIERLEQLASA